MVKKRKSSIQVEVVWRREGATPLPGVLRLQAVSLEQSLFIGALLALKAAPPEKTIPISEERRKEIKNKLDEGPDTLGDDDWNFVFSDISLFARLCFLVGIPEEKIAKALE